MFEKVGQCQVWMSSEIKTEILRDIYRLWKTMMALVLIIMQKSCSCFVFEVKCTFM